LQGEREMAMDNKTIGRFQLTGIPPAPRGIPQIEVTFDIDANGILSVSAVDKATGKEQSIKIQASSGLTEEEVDRMVKDAETNAEADKKKRELIDLKNQSEANVFAARKTIEDLGDNLDQEEKEAIETKATALEEVLKGDDVEMIRAASEALMKTVQEMAGRAYEKAGATQQAAEGSGENAGGGSAEGQDSSAGNPDDPVDADYEVVDD